MYKLLFFLIIFSLIILSYNVYGYKTFFKINVRWYEITYTPPENYDVPEIPIGFEANSIAEIPFMFEELWWDHSWYVWLIQSEDLEHEEDALTILKARNVYCHVDGDARLIDWERSPHLYIPEGVGAVGSEYVSLEKPVPLFFLEAPNYKRSKYAIDPIIKVTVPGDQKVWMYKWDLIFTVIRRNEL